MHEFKSEKLKIDDWATALALGPTFLDPDNFDLKDIADAIDRREVNMRKEVVDFVQGVRQRQDLQSATDNKK